MTTILGSIKITLCYTKEVSNRKARATSNEVSDSTSNCAGAVAERQGVVPAEALRVISFPEDKMLNKPRYTSKITV